MKKLFSNIKDLIALLALVLFISIWFWLPPLLAQLYYGDWTCAYKSCVIIKGENESR